ncbi:17689_t:CDS:1, partial [Gigaspora rosea]
GGCSTLWSLVDVVCNRGISWTFCVRGVLWTWTSFCGTSFREHSVDV